MAKFILNEKRSLNLLAINKKMKKKSNKGTLKTYFYRHDIRDNDACHGREFWLATTAFIEEMGLFLKVRFWN